MKNGTEKSLRVLCASFSSGAVPLVDGARLEQAFNLYAEQRRAVVLAEGLTRRTPPLISAEQMLVIAQSVGYMDPARHAELTFGLCRRAQEAGTGISGRRAVYFGTVPVTTGYFEVLRAQGFAVVDSDIWDQMEPPGRRIEDFSAAAVRRADVLSACCETRPAAAKSAVYNGYGSCLRRESSCVLCRKRGRRCKVGHTSRVCSP